MPRGQVRFRVRSAKPVFMLTKRAVLNANLVLRERMLKIPDRSHVRHAKPVSTQRTKVPRYVMRAPWERMQRVRALVRARHVLQAALPEAAALQSARHALLDGLLQPTHQASAKNALLATTATHQGRQTARRAL
ncbi:hypothetical protein F1559_003673 [Cyanidiococcus yangmingshanensis]|uniref:Uncharacterized protein n=1 Tax=Cyanidiococcus yangmingshanensis TaxID=2690220 RepID=A0A7J7IHH0_9RHOD|nr:hypothetical protein F1559_003673 [Cyanidiococcus yangmingshanensis]